jgi:hypothetical protein
LRKGTSQRAYSGNQKKKRRKKKKKKRKEESPYCITLRETKPLTQIRCLTQDRL